MVWGEHKTKKKLISKVRRTTKNVKKYDDLGGAESGKKIISKGRRTTKNVKKNHGLGELKVEKNSYRRLEGLQKM